jgi:periplasmic divalent cation tolerance protein
MSTDYRLVLCTCPDAATAEQLAHVLVSSSLAACVNIVPGLRSVYRWQDRIETADECLLLIKSRSDCLAALQVALVSHHPYEVPEVITLTVESGYAPYLAWIRAATAAADTIPPLPV